MYDIIVVGAGPAGLTAAIYARRADKSVLVIEKGMFGGQMTFSPKIENYPGFAQISGNWLDGETLDFPSDRVSFGGRGLSDSRSSSTCRNDLCRVLSSMNS